MSAVMAFCPTPGCGQPFEKTSRRQHHCPGDQAAVDRRDSERRNSHRRRLVYDDARWPTTRHVVLVRDDFTCVDCGLVDPTGTELVPDHDPRSIVEILDDACVVGLSLEAAIAEALHHDACKTRCLSCSGRKGGARGSRVAALTGGRSS
jgi:hypothetical protein